MKDDEVLFAAIILSMLAVFGYVAYATHEENMACIKAGGQMVERVCKTGGLK